MRLPLVFFGACVCGASSTPASINGATVGSGPQTQVYSVVSGQDYAYSLYIDKQLTKCLDALPTNPNVKTALDDAAKQYPNALSNLRVKLRLEKMSGFSPSRFLSEGQLLVSSAGGIRYEGKRIFLNCQDYSKAQYEIYFVVEANSG